MTMENTEEELDSLWRLCQGDLSEHHLYRKYRLVTSK